MMLAVNIPAITIFRVCPSVLSSVMVQLSDLLFGSSDNGPSREEMKKAAREYQMSVGDQL